MRIEAKAKHWELWLIILAFSAPVLLSYTWFYFLPPQVARSNYGTLVQPLRPIELMTLRPVAALPPPKSSNQPQWTLLHVVAECPPECRQALFYTRQSHILLNKDHDRMRRVLVLTQPWPATQLAELRQADPDLILLTGDMARLQTLLTHLEGLPGAPFGAFYLVDPLGNLMMTYPLTAEPRGMLKDLRHLLKWSRTG